MTPEEQFEDMLCRMKLWPATGPTRETTILVKAAHALFYDASRPIVDAARLIFCEHPMAVMIRPLILFIFESVDSVVALTPRGTHV
jgi:hypothetical protein